MPKRPAPKTGVSTSLYLRLSANVLQARNSPPAGVIDLPVEIVGNETVCADGTYNDTVIEVAGSMYTVIKEI